MQFCNPTLQEWPFPAAKIGPTMHRTDAFFKRHLN
jgi:hypothetical protein